eukprot:g2370.t1
MSQPMALVLRRLEALEAEKTKDRAEKEKGHLREELKATFTAALEKQALQAEIREQTLRAQIETERLEQKTQDALEKQALRAEIEKQALRAETEKQALALQAEIREQTLRAQIETDKKIGTQRRELEERIRALRAETEKQAMRAEIEKLRAMFEKQTLRADTDKKLLEERMERTRLESQVKEVSHCQSSGADQANAIYLELERMGFKVWYDNRASDLTKEGMLKGIDRAAAFLLFLSLDVLQRPYCQMEIRHALALKKPIVLLHESDARHGGYDFRAAHAAAPTDLRLLLDNNESLPFRRRGYERDGMLKTLVERAGFAQLYASAQEGAGSSQGDGLAMLPAAVSHFALDTLFERPVQAQLVELLLVPKADRRFTSCVLIHGMGGTGKTVTAVAAVQERAVRAHHSEIYWLTVGADAVNEKIQQLQSLLYKQIAGTGMKGEGKDEHERQAMLVAAMAGGKQRRALVVLDDPWMPEQVRFLNPIDGSQSKEHRLLITTRIRDLVPKATRVELPLMGKDEAVALLLELANVEEASYLKEQPGASWPPQAAYTIAAECGLLPVTLTIAAQVVRSWGEGWETAVLPLLREQEGSGGQGGKSTAEERVIGAGLQALAKHEDGAAIKDLFHMLAVTQEDFVHPIAVIELLWRSCCASDAEKQEGSLTTRLKVRQWTQMLVDHSLLLGSSSEGIHLHDIVLQYLRKRLSAEEMRAVQGKVVEGMMAASEARVAATGRGLQDTGSTSRAFAGEEVDWYCCNIGPYHVQRARDPSAAAADDERVQRWVLESEPVIVRAVATAVGAEDLATLVVRFLQEERWVQAAKVEWASSAAVGGLITEDGRAHMKAALNLIEGHDLSTLEAQKLELLIRAAGAGIYGKRG